MSGVPRAVTIEITPEIEKRLAEVRGFLSHARKIAMPRQRSRHMPRYPVYVISKGRHDRCLTARFLIRDKVPFRLVVEPQEVELYSAEFDPDLLLVTPFSNLGQGSIPARNFVWEHAIETGADRHWILDDNILSVMRRVKGQRLYCDSGIAFRVAEDWTDRYENLAITGLAYKMFVPETQRIPPFWLNCHVYSCLLIRNELPHRWRGRYNEDTDLCLQVLSDGWCTATINAFMVDKIASMVMPGGNMTELYQGDGRLKMARSLERMWPGVVTTARRFGRPQHVVHSAWRKFDTPLVRRTDIDWSKIEPVDNYGMRVIAVDEVKHPRMKDLLDEND